MPARPSCSLSAEGSGARRTGAAAALTGRAGRSAVWCSGRRGCPRRPGAPFPGCRAGPMADGGVRAGDKVVGERGLSF